MGIQFSLPWALLSLLIVALVIVYFYRKDRRLSGFRKKLAFTLRTVGLVLLVLALAGMQSYTMHKEKDLVFVIDRSDSMPDGSSKAIQDWLMQGTAGKGEKDRFAVVTTGLESMIERNMSAMPSNFAFSAMQNRQFTNMEQGLQVANSLLSVPESSRIVLVTDGEENVGSALRQAKLVQNRGIPIDVLPIPRQVSADVAIEQLKIPEKLYQAEKFAFEVLVRSTIAGEGELRIYEDNQEIAVQPVTVERGENRIVLQGLAKTPGFHQYRAEIFMEEDVQSVNNVGYAFSKVTGAPRVLVVEGQPDSSGNLAAVLESGMIDYEIIAPEVFPRELVKLTAYDSIILHNVSAERFSGSQMEHIERAVSSYGIGLMMIGGEDSFGMGGYFKTPIEKALPVRMELEGKREIPSLGLILVIDRSGSMEGDKMELAKESAIRTVELMRSKDTVGVVAFDSEPWWVVEPQKLEDKQAVINQIKSIQAQGGTEIYPALYSGFTKLKEIDAQRKHMILLTDGQSATDPGYDAMLKEMVEQKMTLSTVAVGMDADTSLLEWLAKEAKGRYYFTNDQSTLPAIFSREAVMMARSYIVNQPFVPQIAQAGDWAKWFVDGVPPIQAYVASTAKEAAESVLVSPEPDPLLARWQYGSGRSVAWTSDLTGKWSKDWIGWNKFSQVFTQAIKWTFPQFVASPYELNVEQQGNEVVLNVSAADTDGEWDELKAVITDDRMQSQEVTLTQRSPGEFTGSLFTDQSGAFIVNLTPSIDGKVQEGVSAGNLGFVVPYSPEYRIPASASAGDALLKQLVELTGGRMLSLEQPEQIFSGETIPRKQLYDLRQALLIAVLMLWLADIAVRRLSIRWELAFSWLTAGFRRRHGRNERDRSTEHSDQALEPNAHQPGQEAETPTASSVRMQRLQQRKRQTGRFYGQTGGSLRNQSEHGTAGESSGSGRLGNDSSGRLSNDSSSRMGNDSGSDWGNDRGNDPGSDRGNDRGNDSGNEQAYEQGRGERSNRTESNIGSILQATRNAGRERQANTQRQPDIQRQEQAERKQVQRGAGSQRQDASASTGTGAGSGRSPQPDSQSDKLNRLLAAKKRIR